MDDFLLLLLASIGVAIVAALSTGVGYLIGCTTTHSAAARKLESVRDLEQRTLRHLSNHRVRLRDARRLLESEHGDVARVIAKLLAFDAEFLREFAAIQRGLEQLAKGSDRVKSKPRQADRVPEGPAPLAECVETDGDPADKEPQRGPAHQDQEPLRTSTDNRQEIRHSCRMPYLIAPYDNGRLPMRGQFREYEGRDISSKGFSFAASSRPDFSSLVVAIGDPPRLKYLTARVANVVEIEEDGRRLHRVGCAFTGRLHNSLFE